MRLRKANPLAVRGALWLMPVVLNGAAQPRPTAQIEAPPVGGVLLARQGVLRARPLKMVYCRDEPSALESLAAHAGEMTLVAPQSFWVDADGIVHGAVPPDVAEIARSARLPVMPLVVNRGFDRATASALLRNVQARERAATYLAYLAKRDQFVGFQLDLENIDPADKGLFTRFVERAAARLHRDGLLVSVAVVPRFSDDFPGRSKSGEFSTGPWGAPYDYRALGRAVDFVTVMTYDHHGRLGPPGPIAGYAWVEEVLDYAVRRLPRQRLLLGIPFYGRDWAETDHGVTARGLTFKDAAALLDQNRVQAQWDERWRSPWLQYRDAASLHTVWYEDSRSLGEKLRLMRKYRLRGFAAWRLGAEDPQFWALAKTAAPAREARTARRALKPNQRPVARRAAASAH